MNQTCRAAVFTGQESYEIREFPMPDPPRGGAVLRVEAVGMCASDLAQWHGLPVLGCTYPVVPGHEIVGVIERLDEDAQLGVSEGDRVAVDEVIGGGADMAALKVYGYTDMTGDGGPDLYGGYGEYMKVLPGTTLHKFTSSAPPEDLALFEPLASAINWVDLPDIKPGSSIVVQGPGHMGMTMLAVLRTRDVGNVIVTGTSRDAERLAVARSMGAHTINVDDRDAVDEIASLTGGRMADVVYDVTPVPAAVQAALEFVRYGGKVVIAGLKEMRRAEVDTDMIVTKGLRIFGGRAYTHRSLAEAIRLLNEDRIDTAPIRGTVLGLDDLESAMRFLLRQDPLSDPVRVAIRHTHG